MIGYAPGTVKAGKTTFYGALPHAGQVGNAGAKSGTASAELEMVRICACMGPPREAQRRGP
ncbi:hypothetical protein C9I57_21275 [Trinickia symbiotica]|uniref:Uncharacterized protein n=1 Tax=Trinickia symbiotica TaxID=863227 RepID=A0A2T3XPW8_9BURK|nr:hypothetical protein C9I57_21275 [Trinickia symbiotica]